MPRHVRRFQARRPPGIPGQPAQVPTKATKALVAAVITLAGLVGLHLTEGTAQLVVGVLQVLFITYGVWRTRNAPKEGPAGPGVEEFMS